MRCVLLISLALAAALTFDAGAAEPRADFWPTVRASLFKDRAITEDTGGEIVTLHAPARAQDASVVPVSISTRIEQSAARYVSKVYLLIDQNPSPVAAIFTFTPDSGRADIETRVRVEDYTWMRAVAEMNDGSLFMSARYVKAAGGCSAPYGTAPDFDAREAVAALRGVTSLPTRAYYRVAPGAWRTDGTLARVDRNVTLVPALRDRLASSSKAACSK